MAFKDTFEKLISYFDTDEVSDVEETTTGTDSEIHTQKSNSTVNAQNPSQTTRSNQTHPPRTAQRPQQTQPSPRQHAPVPPRRPMENTIPSTVRPVGANQESFRLGQASEQQTTIALKYPRQYDDAQEIVDLLIVNECVLIDFQYMLDAQARRCLDFIDGASKVLYGKLQKVGPSMFLLTPSNVVVDIEELNHQHPGQDLGFDYDMKRR